MCRISPPRRPQAARGVQRPAGGARGGLGPAADGSVRRGAAGKRGGGLGGLLRSAGAQHASKRPKQWTAPTSQSVAEHADSGGEESSGGLRSASVSVCVAYLCVRGRRPSSKTHPSGRGRRERGGMKNSPLGVRLSAVAPLSSPHAPVPPECARCRREWASAA